MPVVQRIERHAPAEGAKIALHIIFDGMPRTGSLLDAVARFARQLDAHVTVLVPQVVPYPLPLEQPPVSIAFTEEKLAALPANVEIYLCRDRCEAILSALPQDSLVAMSRVRWWHREARRLARLLRQNGHRIVFLPQGT